MDSTKVTCDQNKGKGNGKLLNKDEKERTGGWGGWGRTGKGKIRQKSVNNS
jgi:hypothetical protein